MNYNSRKENGLLVINFHEKRLDATVAVELKEILATCIENGDTDILLNISEVEFIDSSALGSIVSSLKRIGNKGDLFFSGAQENVKRLFSLTRMDRVLQIFPTVDEAVEMFVKGGH